MSWRTLAKSGLARLLRWPGGHLLLYASSALFAPRHRIGVLLAIRDPEGRILLLRHVFHPRCPWGLPGGWLQPGELPEEGARRELHEETGLSAGELRLLFVSLEVEPRHLAMVFEARGVTGSMQLGLEVVEARYFDPERLPQVIAIAQRAARESSR